MRAIRTLAALTLAATLLATPALALAQSSDPAAAGSLPLTRQPDGALPLEGTPWRLQWYRWKDTERVPGPEVAARMRLVAGGLEASGGCTPFKGSYGTSGRAVDFKLKRLKKNDCGEQATMVQLAMVDGLKDAVRFEITTANGTSRLALFDHAGTELLRFGLDDVSTFAGTWPRTEWALVAYTVDGTRRDPDPVATPNLIFVADTGNEAKRRSSGIVRSSTGCNSFTGEFFLHANVASFGELTVTDVPCPGALLAQQEALLAVFDASAVEVALPADRLILTSVDTGETLEYRAVPEVERTTWFLSPVPERGREDETVTFRMEGGAVAGEGPCGPYSANYVTDGLFVTFADVRGAGAESCARAKDERKLLAALRSAVRFDRDPGKVATYPRLTLRDARGAAVARFEYPFGSTP